jgi:transposase
MPLPVSNEIRSRIVERFYNGSSIEELVLHMGVPKYTIKRILTTFEATGQSEMRPRGGDRRSM